MGQGGRRASCPSGCRTIPSQATEPTRWSYFHADAQNNRLLTDGSGAVSHRWEYDPFGNVRDESGSARSEFGYADEQRDGETGLINLRARYYDPGLGRFLSRDAFGGLDADPQGWNRYSYVENNPVTGTDPSGHYGRGLPKAQVRALGREFAAGRFTEQNLSLIRRLTKDQYRQITGRLSNGVRKRLDRIAEPNEKEDDSKRSRLRKSCRNPGQYTGSCPGGPPNRGYIADQLAAEQAKLAGRAAQERREVADNATPTFRPDAAFPSGVTVPSGTVGVYEAFCENCEVAPPGSSGHPGQGGPDPRMGSPRVYPGEVADDNRCFADGDSLLAGNAVNVLGCGNLITLGDGQRAIVTPTGIVLVSNPVPLSTPPGGGGSNSGNQRVIVTEDEGEMARRLGVTKRQVGDAIHGLKRKIPGNPNVGVELPSGDVYDKRSGEHIGNLRDEIGIP